MKNPEAKDGSDYIAHHQFAERLHHHAILAVHPIHVPRMDELIEDETLVIRLSPKIMTTHIRKCDPMCLLYASKMLKKYPEFLHYPDWVPFLNSDQVGSTKYHMTPEVLRQSLPIFNKGQTINE